MQRDRDGTPIADGTTSGMCANPECNNIHMTAFVDGRPVCVIVWDAADFDAMVARIQADRYRRAANR